MSGKIITQLSIDFHDTTYKSVNAKLYDRASRFIEVTCYNQGKIHPIDNARNTAYIRYRKTDNLGVFNSCKITSDGKILVELTEQMLVSVGNSCADLIVLNKINTESESYNFEVVNDEDGNSSLIYPHGTDGEKITVTATNFGDIITEGKYSILSTMTFYVNVIKTPYDNTEIESTYEYDALNDLLIKANETYIGVIIECRKSETNAKASENNAKQSASNAKASENNAKQSEINSGISESNAKISETNAKNSELKAKESENNIKGVETRVSASEVNVKNSEATVVEKTNESYNNAILSKSYAVGGTNTRTNEDTDNAQYYYKQTIGVYEDLAGKTFMPIENISFSELSTVEKEGYIYHIKDSFVTDDRFKYGAGVSYPAGTNVYYTEDGYWDIYVDRFATVGEFKILSDMITKLQNRIEELEKQTVLEITE